MCRCWRSFWRRRRSPALKLVCRQAFGCAPFFFRCRLVVYVHAICSQLANTATYAVVPCVAYDAATRWWATAFALHHHRGPAAMSCFSHREWHSCTPKRLTAVVDRRLYTCSQRRNGAEGECGLVEWRCTVTWDAAGVDVQSVESGAHRMSAVKPGDVACTTFCSPTNTGLLLRHSIVMAVKVAWGH